MPVSLPSVVLVLLLAGAHVLHAVDPHDVQEKQGVKKRLSLQSTGESPKRDVSLRSLLRCWSSLWRTCCTVPEE